jgi:hypothetical protein
MRYAEALIAAVVAGKPAVARKAVRSLTEHQIADLGLALLPVRQSLSRAKAAKRKSTSSRRRS